MLCAYIETKAVDDFIIRPKKVIFSLLIIIVLLHVLALSEEYLISLLLKYDVICIPL